MVKTSGNLLFAYQDKLTLFGPGGVFRAFEPSLSKFVTFLKSDKKSGEIKNFLKLSTVITWLENN